MFGMNNPRISVISLTFHDTGSFGNQVLRTYETKVDNYSVTNINETIRNTQQKTGGVTLTPYSLKSAVGNAISVSTRPTQSINIDNGWGENRLRFVLILEVENSLNSPPTIYYFQGYTDHRGISHGGHIDPNMILIINSYLAVKKVEVKSQMGANVYNRVVQASNIINLSQTDYTRNFSTVRPTDVFSTMQASTFIANQPGEIADIFDTRVLARPNDPISSHKKNSNATDYLASLINSYSLGVTMSESESENPLSQIRDNSSVAHAMTMSKDPALSENPFVRALSSVIGSPGNITRFTMNSLAEIDQSFINKINYIDGSKMLASVQSFNNYESWSSQTRETIASTLIFNGVAAIMMDMFIMNISFVSTNGTHNGVPTTTIVNANSPDTHNLPRLLELLCYRFENEIMWGLTFNNQDTYMVEVSIDLYGASYMTISFNGEPASPFQRASFADSLYQPVVAADSFHRDTLAKDVNTLLNGLDLGVYTYDKFYSPSANLSRTNQTNYQTNIITPDNYI